MADAKTFTEDEHLAILTDRVAKETAAITADRDKVAAEKSQLETKHATEVSELQTKLDVTESAKVAAEQKAEKVEQEFADYKAGIEQLAEQAARKDERLAKVKEVAAHLGEDFFKDEARVERIVAMDEDGFTGYLDDLKATAPAGTTSSTAPRETAMALAGTTAPSKSAARSLLLGRFEKED